MDTDTSLMWQQLIQQWDAATGTLERMSLGANVLPNDGWTHIRPADNGTEDFVRFELRPVVFNVPEHASHSSRALYVVAEGYLELNREEFRTNGMLVTQSFSTRAGYFRKKGGVLEHVYGAHYDLSIDELGHPTFHSQFRSFLAFGAHILREYKLTCEVVDRLDGVLRNVRLPTAQMDFFSLILQVYADHLLMRNSGKEEKAAFNNLLQKSESLRGAGSRSSRLTSPIARSCYRSLHWYPVQS